MKIPSTVWPSTCEELGQQIVWRLTCPSYNWTCCVPLACCDEGMISAQHRKPSWQRIWCFPIIPVWCSGSNFSKWLVLTVRYIEIYALQWLKDSQFPRLLHQVYPCTVYPLSVWAVTQFRFLCSWLLSKPEGLLTKRLWARWGLPNALPIYSDAWFRG